MEPVIIIGSGLAGYTLAKELRKLSDVKIVLISEDDAAFYSKPMLSNAITKRKTPQELVNFTFEQMASQHKLEILPGHTVESIDTKDQQLTTQQGQKISYSKLVMAVGARPIRIFDDDKSNIFSVNNLQQYAAFRNAIKDKKHIAIIGAGLIGCEFANDLADNGYKVDVVAAGDTPLDKLLPQQVALQLQDSLHNKGVQWHLKTTAESVIKNEGTTSLTLTNGNVLQADVVLSAIGLQANIELAQKTGLNTNRGIVVDNYCCTSNTNIYALGDCAEMNGKVLPFVMPVMTAARALAKTLTGEPTRVHYPLMPIILKTPACPIVVCPPELTIAGQWQYEQSSDGIIARFVDEKDCIQGFCLTGSHIAKKQVLLKEMQG